MKVDGKAIRALIAEKHLTFRAVSRKTGLTDRGLHRIIESGSCYPFNANAIATALDVPLDVIRRTE